MKAYTRGVARLLAVKPYMGALGLDSTARNVQGNLSQSDMLRGRQHEPGWVGGNCKHDRHSKCYSLACSCHCHKREAA